MLALNTQPPEKQELREDGALEVVSVFRTLQGEGPLAGTPAVFVRLAGCTLTCPLCDSDYTTGRAVYTAEELSQEVLRVGGDGGKCPTLAVLTGGEPLRQNVVPFIRGLLVSGFRVQVETNGTLYVPGLDHLWLMNKTEFSVVCSPKTPRISVFLAPAIHSYKYVLEAGNVDESDGLPLSSLGMNGAPARPHEGFRGEVFLQPADVGDPDGNAANVRAAAASCLRFGHRMSLQTHKALGLE